MQSATHADLTGTVRDVQEELRERYDADTASLSTDNGSGAALTLRLEYLAFDDLTTAFEFIGEVAFELQFNHEARVTAGVNAEGFEYAEAEEATDGPAGWVSAKFPDDDSPATAPDGVDAEEG